MQHIIRGPFNVIKMLLLFTKSTAMIFSLILFVKTLVYELVNTRRGSTIVQCSSQIIGHGNYLVLVFHSLW